MKSDQGVMKMNTLGRLVMWLACVVFSYGNLIAQNWSVKTPINASVNFNGVFFTNDQVGYAVGSGGAIYKTIDGGLSWIPQTSNTTESLSDVYFVNNNTGFSVGANGTIRKTINAGTTWTPQAAAGTASTLFYQVHFINANNGFIVGSGGKIIKTTDGGTNWSTLTSGTANDLRAVQFTTLNIGYVAGDGGKVLNTLDGGTNWTTQTLGAGDRLNDIHFVDANTGYLAGYGGYVWKTTDAGVNWVDQMAYNGFSLEIVRVFFTDLINGHASSNTGYSRITYNGGTNWFTNSILVSGEGLHFPSANTGYRVGTSGSIAKYQSELEPEYHPSDLAFTEVFSSSMQVSYTASPDIPTGYIAIRKTGSAPTSIPMDGIEHTLNETLADGSTVVYLGNSTSFNQSGLVPGTQYFYNIFSYNGSGTAINYKVVSPLAGSQSTYTTGAPWTSMTSDSYQYPKDVHFFDANAGGIAGFYMKETTINGGQSWILGGADGDFYGGIFYVNQTTAYAVGGNGSQRVIRRTVNGGTTWVDQVRTPSTYFLNDVWFSGPTTGIAVGMAGNILRTTTGTSWSPVTSGTASHLYGVSFANSTTGIAVGQGATIRNTINGGATWFGPMYLIPTSADLNDVSFVNTTTAYAVGTAGTIIKFDGVNWTLQNSGTTNDLNGVHFLDANTGYAVGMSGTVLKTINGGTTWSSFATSAGNTDNFYGVNFPTSHIGYIVGYTGVDAKIFKYQSVPEPTGQPTSLNFSLISATGQTISFSSASGSANGYIVIRRASFAPTSTPLDGIGYTVGSTLGDGIVAYAGSSTSFTETTLTPGTDYNYKIYSYNSSGTGASTNYLATSPLYGNSVTTLLPPVANAPSSMLSTGFTANWTAVAGASGYRLDVSTDGFSSFVSGYNNFSASGNTSVVTGLSPGTSYSYRVRSVNVSGASLNSNTIVTITVPSAPTSSAATLITTTSFTANWVASVGATGYRLDVSAASNFSPNIGGYDNLSVSGLSAAIPGLTPGTLYYYRIRAENASGTSVNSSTISPITLCLPPTANAASSITAVSFTANWTAAIGAVDYRIDVSSDPSFSFIVGSYNNQTVTGTSLVVSGLGAGTNYYYRVRTSNASGSSSNSGPISVLTLPAAPVANDAVSVATTTFSANWNPVPTATGYFIDVAAASDFSSPVSGYTNLGVAATSTTVTVPTAGITYYYRVRAVNATGTSANSNAITTLLKPAAPVATAASTFTTGGFTANWASASGAVTYSLEVSADNFSSITSYDNLNVTTLAISGLNAGTTYKYRVTAVNAFSPSATSNVITTVTVAPAPVATSATTFSTSGFTATWSSTQGASNYRLDVSTAANNFSPNIVGYDNLIVTGTSASISGLTPGILYQYRLRAVNASGTSGNSNTMSTSTLSIAPTASLATSITSTGFTASWTSVTGASDYRIDVSIDNGFSSFVGTYNNQTVGGTSIALTGLVAGTTYYYRVRASNASGSSANSNIIDKLINPAAPIAIAASLITTTGFTANWGAVSGATGYRLDVSASQFNDFVSGFNNLPVAGTTQAVTGLTPGGTYYIRVRAINATGASDNSNTITTFTVPDAIVATTASSITSSSFSANWNIASGATATFLDVATDVGFTSLVSGYNNRSVSSTVQSVTGLSSGTNYFYRLRASNVSGTSLNSNVISTITLPAAPTASAASAINATGFTASWSDVTGEIDYRLDVSTDNTFNNFPTNNGSISGMVVGGTSQIVTSLSSGTTYYYRVRATNASGISANSSTINVLTFPGGPVATAATSVTNTSFSANWNSVTSATGYLLDVSTSSTFSGFVFGYNNLSVAGTSATVTASTLGITYYYRVRAVNATGTSSNSNSIVMMGSPVPAATTGITTSAFTANWAAVPGTTEYRIDVATDNAFLNMLANYTNGQVNTTNATITGLEAGRTYFYRVRASNTVVNSANSATVTVQTFPAAPTANDATSITSTTFVASWNSITSATSYRLDVSTTNTFNAGTFVSGFNDLTVATTSATVTLLTPGTNYFYRVRAISTAGTSANSNVITTLIKTATPVANDATTISETGFTANWSAVANITGYYLDVSSNNFSSLLSGHDNEQLGPVTQLIIIGLTPGTTYQYRVRSYNATGSSASSSIITTITKPPAPVATSASDFTPTSFTAKWQATTGASSYSLDVSSDPAFGSFFPGFENLPVTGTSSNVSGLTSGTAYYYLVRAVNVSGTSPNSNTISSTNIPPPPPVTSATSITTTSFTANWSTTSGALSYLLDVSDNNFSSFVSGYADLSVSGNSQSVTGLVAGTAYQYRVRAANASGTSTPSSTISVQTLPAEPTAQATAMNFSAITTSTMNVSFAAATGGANGYVVIRKTASSPTGLPNDGVTYSSGSSIGDGTVAYVGSATNFSETGLSSGIVYFYNVYAYNGSGISTNYNTNSPLEGSKVTLPDAPVTLAATLVGQTLFNANWILASGATGYFIDVSTDDFSTFVTGYNNQPTGNVTSFGVNSLTAAAAYQYRVRTVNASGSSINSSIISLVTIPPTPTALASDGVSTTGFTANWSGTGTTNFFIDVSSDNFSTFVTGYNNLAVTGAFSQNITGLNIGTAYKYRVRSSNATGVSPSSNATSANTLVADPTAQPTALTFSNVTINSLDVSFVLALGSPTGYLVLRKVGSAPIDVPLDGIVYIVGSSIGSSTVVNVGSTSFSEISLSNEANYFYSIYSYNGAGASINYLITGPLQGNKSTLAVEPTSQPTLLKFASATAGLYSVSFTPTSASGYLVLRKQGTSPTEIPVDGVSYAIGSSLGSSTVTYFSNASTFDESLLSNSTYFYSVFAFNGAGTSVNYRAISPLAASVLTLPDAPVAKPSSNNTTTTFDANWDAVSGTGTVTYEVEVSKDDFATILQSLPLISATTVRINNLLPSTDYQYRVKGKNASGLSANSTSIAARTLDVALANALRINTNPSDITVPVGFGQRALSANVSGGVGTRVVVLKYRPIMGNTYTSISTTDKGNDNVEATITESMLDDLGLEFYFEATDQAGTLVKSSGNSFVYKSKSAAAIEAIPFTSNFGGTSATYEMFSLPYVLTDKNISGIFDELGAPDKTQWRLFHFQGGKYIEYPDNITTLEIGQGYWFNTKEKIDIKPGAGDLAKANQTTPFQLTVEAGWNQIGNPYPFNIDWKTIKDANQAAGLNSLWLFEESNYVKKDVLAKFKGAFVFSDKGGTINFPLSAKTSSPGRTNGQDLMPTIDEAAWRMPIQLSFNGLLQVSSIGMHPEARTSKDKFDEITIPRFIDYLEMDTYHEEFFAHNFSSDVVPTTHTSSWLFTVSSNQKGSEATITWDQQALFGSHAKLALLDLQSQTLVDMKTTNIYRFSWTEGRQFKILYSKEGELLPGITLLGNAYPNPFNAAVTIPFMLEQDQSNVEVVVYDMLGRKVKSISKADVKAGIHNLDWNGGNEQGDAVESGMYFYQLRGDKGILSSIKRLLKQ